MALSSKRARPNISRREPDKKSTGCTSNYRTSTTRNGISAATGLSGNDCDRDEALRRFSIRVGSEGVRIGQALGYALERIQNIEPERLALAGEGDAAALEEAEAVLLAVTNSGARSDLQRPSMAQDMLKGRRTEIDHINGFIVREGAKAGRAAPANAALTDAVRRVERGEAPARREMVADLRPGQLLVFMSSPLRLSTTSIY